MQFTDYWQQFEHTGRVEDYLNYLQSAGKAVPPGKAGGGCPGDCRAEGAEPFTPGRKDHAGIPVCNGNGIKTDTFR